MGEMGVMGHFGKCCGQMTTTHFSMFSFASYEFLGESVHFHRLT